MRLSHSSKNPTIQGLEAMLQPSLAAKALTLPATALQAWCKYRLFSFFESQGFLVIPDHEGCDLLVYDSMTETPVAAVQVAGTPLTSKVAAMFQAVPNARLLLYVVTSQKKARVYGHMARLPPTLACYSPHLGWLQVPPALIT